MESLPKDIQNIIYDYVHQIKMNKLMKELLEVTSTFNGVCDECGEDMCSITLRRIGKEEYCEECYIKETSFYNY